MSVDSTEALRSESLDSWKEIAAYLKRDVRTVQRWERHEGLPVHRKLHDKVSSIYAYKSELDRWWRKESSDIASSSETALPRRPLLAVLPLRNLGLEQDNDYFSDGLTEELIAQLSRINPEQLGVIARASIARYKGNTTDINRIARELGASYIVDGIVRRSDRRVRVAVQLIGMSDQGHLWADSYDRDLQDVLELQAKIARAVTAQISVKLTAREEKRLKGSRAISPEAYENYLRGRFFWNQRSSAGLTRAIELFERAISLDASYAPAHCGLADCYSMLSTVAVGAVNPALAMPRAREAARRALELDPQLAEAYASAAYVTLFYEWDWPSAEALFEKCLELNASYATGRQWYAEFLNTLGLVNESHAQLLRAQELDPFSVVISASLASMYYFGRQYDNSIELSRRVLDVEPNFMLIYLNLGRALVQKGRYGQAISALRKALEKFPNNAALMMVLGYAYAAAGKKTEARGTMKSLKRLAAREYVPAFYFSAIHTGLGDYDEAFASLEEARSQRCEYLALLNREPAADPIRSDPRFAAIVPQPPGHMLNPAQ